MPASERGAAAAATNAKWQERTGSRRDAGVQFGAAQGGSAAEPRLGGFCQLVRVVRRPAPQRVFARPSCDCASMALEEDPRLVDAGLASQIVRAPESRAPEPYSLEL